MTISQDDIDRHQQAVQAIAAILALGVLRLRKPPRQATLSSPRTTAQRPSVPHRKVW